MFQYHQSSGVTDHDGLILGTGYSGAGPGKNACDYQNVPDVGPIPQGTYTIGDPFDSPTHGPHAMRLTPDPENEMFGRSAFLIHGDNPEHIGESSEGCIVLACGIREMISASADNRLTVVA